MILGKIDIEKLVASKGIIENYEPSLSQGNPAKVVLRLGCKCYLSSQETDIIDLSIGASVVIKPNDIFLYQTFEKVKIPNNIAGHTSLNMGNTARGLLMSNQTQVDPGYNNYLFGMLYNLSDNDIELKCGESIVTLELYKISNPTTMSYQGHMANICFEEFCKKRVGSSLGKLSSGLESQVEKIEELTRSIDKTAVKNDRRLNILMALVSVVTLIIAFIAIKPDADVARLSEKVEYQQQTISELKEKLTRLESSNISAILPETEKNETDDGDNNISEMEVTSASAAE